MNFSAKLFSGESPEVVKQNLQAMAYKIKSDEKYMKDLSQEEIEAHRALLTESAIKLQDLDDEMKAQRARIKAEKTEHQQQYKKSILAVRTAQEEATGTLYFLDDQETRTMACYDESGNLLNTRPLLPEERQASILTVSRAANDYL